MKYWKCPNLAINGCGNMAKYGEMCDDCKQLQMIVHDHEPDVGIAAIANEDVKPLKFWWVTQEYEKVRETIVVRGYDREDVEQRMFDHNEGKSVRPYRMDIRELTFNDDISDWCVRSWNEDTV